MEANTPFVRPDQYSFNYEAEIAEFYRMFPDKVGEIGFVDSSAQDAPEAVGGLSVNFHDPLYKDLGLETAAAKGGYITDLYLKRMLNMSRGIAVGEIDPSLPTRFVVMPATKDTPVNGYFPEFKEMDQAHTFDHETGHGICCEGYPNSIEVKNGEIQLDAKGLPKWLRKEDWQPRALIAECVADAYATIRHFQRFGTETAYKHKMVIDRGFTLMFGTGEGAASHFTQPVVAKIVEDSERVEWSKLTPQQTADMAYEYAVRYAPAYYTVKATQEIFAPLREDFSMDKVQDLLCGVSRDANVVNTIIATLKPLADDPELTGFYFADTPEDAIEETAECFREIFNYYAADRKKANQSPDRDAILRAMEKMNEIAGAQKEITAPQPAQKSSAADKNQPSASGSGKTSGGFMGRIFGK